MEQATDYSSLFTFSLLLWLFFNRAVLLLFFNRAVLVLYLFYEVVLLLFLREGKGRFLNPKILPAL
jgi:hypothetical protein